MVALQTPPPLNPNLCRNSDLVPKKQHKEAYKKNTYRAHAPPQDRFSGMSRKLRRDVSGTVSMSLRGPSRRRCRYNRLQVQAAAVVWEMPFLLMLPPNFRTNN